ncbi:metal ABC transporter substrate-binding protein [Desulforamulus aeronauticus]|uniref:Zinc transport system substrate-binding protein n=1 Tax=Desulforamulus aeronauticus DSM 10349 TaxID=1121421 RepID=A0A1M6VS34_9FIRM|nr:metal ABC transporter substrate-binding protein [Desulforamulus aeronauticus]SHK84194.1 zinc transport system substrate-binding protein [Desulforamulus aeronauticus DSM 10349]
MIRGRLAVVILALVFISSSFLSGCANNRTSAEVKDKIVVYTSIYPLYDFTRKIGGDKVEVRNVVPAGGEPHEWEPSPRNLADLGKAAVFIYCGSGIEPWLEKTLPSIDQNKVLVNAGRNIELLPAKEEQTAHGNQQDDHHHAKVDPHIWVDPLNAVIMVDHILSGLVQADEQNKAYYQANAAAFKKQLLALHKEYETALAGAQGKEFVVSHAAFGYLAHRYGLKQVAIRGLSPEVEPSPNDMAEIVKLAREKGIKYIFTESLVSPKVSEALASELSAKTLVLNPVGGLTKEEIAAGKDYLSVMGENLKNLKLAVGVNV